MAAGKLGGHADPDPAPDVPAVVTLAVCVPVVPGAVQGVEAVDGVPCLGSTLSGVSCTCETCGTCGAGIANEETASSPRGRRSYKTRQYRNQGSVVGIESIIVGVVSEYSMTSCGELTLEKGMMWLDLGSV